MTLTAAIIAVQAAKNNHPALERNESLKVMEVIAHSLSVPRFQNRRGAARGPRAGDSCFDNKVLIPVLLPAPIAR
jgi:hypothetical protein